MSAETLRLAVARIHHDVDFGQAHGDDTFLLAVADWLEDTGRLLDATHPNPACDLRYDGNALSVARSYLGESA